MKKRKVKGVISIFLCMLTGGLAEFSVITADGIRVNEEKEIMSDAAALAVMAAGNCYNKEIYADLDMVLYTKSMAETEAMISEILIKNRSGISLTGLSMDAELRIVDQYMLCGKWYQGICYPAALYADRVAEDKNIDRCICHETDSFDPEMYARISSFLLSKEAEDDFKDLTGKENLYKLCYDHIFDMGAVDKESYDKRFSADIADWAGVPGAKDDFKKADIQGGFLDDMASALLTVQTAEKGETMFRYINGNAYYYDEWLDSKYDVLNIYIRDHFDSFITADPDSDGLVAKREYILYGNMTDRENVAKALSEILKYRIYMNTKALCKKYGEDASFRHALAESWYDILILSRGSSVPWEKKADAFVTEKGDDLEKISKKAKKTDSKKEADELTYDDYLTQQFYLSYYSGRIVCGETVSAGIFDMLGFDYGIDPRQAYISASVSIEFKMSDKGNDKMFSTIGKMMTKKMMSNRTYTIGG